MLLIICQSEIPAIKRPTWKLGRRHHTAILLIKNSTWERARTRMSEQLQLWYRRQDPAQFVRTVAFRPMRVLYTSCPTENAQPRGTAPALETRNRRPDQTLKPRNAACSRPTVYLISNLLCTYM